MYFLSGYPRIAVAELTPERLRTELSRCVTPSRDPAG
jgi:hypothetical protein